ncbi:MAG: histone deacetylase [Spirochaetales bacterium]|nr:histone deacetylase [Spirochaetales bacterium]MCF7939828.1 histone deacetylase [Spirochaetales bacterium]
MNGNRSALSPKRFSDTGRQKPVLPVVYHENYSIPLPRRHRFPMPKFAMIYRKLKEEGLADLSNTWVPEPISREVLYRIHEREYVDRFIEGSISDEQMQRIGLPWSGVLVERSRLAVAGTLLTARLAQKYGMACHTAGGTHHARREGGAGFCVFNDLAAAARELIAWGDASRVLIVDLDVHQGDGTAQILRGVQGAASFSIHCEVNYPEQKERGDLDVALPAGTGDEEYLEVLRQNLPRALSAFRPDLVIFDAGVDVHRGDRLGRFQMSGEGIRKRDRMVIGQCRSLGIPVAAVIGGGYSPLGDTAAVNALVERHALLFRTAAEYARDPGAGQTQLDIKQNFFKIPCVPSGQQPFT